MSFEHDSQVKVATTYTLAAITFWFLMYIQLLWVNLIMDTLGALALAMEPPTDNHYFHFPVPPSLRPHYL